MALILLLLVHAAALVVPGIDNFMVSQTAAQQGNRAGRWVGLGVVAAILLWATVTVTGLSFVLAQPVVHWLITLLGAAYLLWLAFQLLTQPAATASSTNALPVSSHQHIGWWLLRGFLTNLSNPKAVIYFTSIFAAFLTPGTTTQGAFLMVAAIVIESLCWFMLLAHLFSMPGVTRAYGRHQGVIERFAAVLFVGFAIYILWLQLQPIG